MALRRQIDWRLMMTVVGAVGVGVFIWPVIVLNFGSIRASHTLMSVSIGTGDKLALRSSHPRANLWQARLALRQGNPNLAIDILNKSMSTEPLEMDLLAEAYDSSENMHEAVRLWVGLGNWRELRQAGMRALTERRIDDASLALESAFHLKPDESVLDWASLLVRRDDLGEAEFALESTIERFPGDARTLTWRLQLGNILLKDKQWSEAEAAFRAAVAQDGLCAEAHVGLGQALYYSGQALQLAVREINAGIESAPNQAAGYAALGDIYRVEKDYSNADRYYVSALEREPDNVSVISRRIDALMEAGNVAVALDIASGAVVRLPTAPHLFYELGEIYSRQGLFDRAVTASERAVTLDAGSNPLYLLSLASIYTKAGRFDEAIAIYRSVLSRLPDNAQALRALTQLEARP